MRKGKQIVIRMAGVLICLCLLLLSGYGRETKEKAVEKTEEITGMKTIYLAGGCFWGTQKYFDQFDGVMLTEVGYANGPDEAPTYRQVCSNSGHAETVRVVYDETKLSLTRLLQYYFLVIDPLSVNRQGNDTGIQYRTGIYYTEPEQLEEIEAVYAEQEEKAGQKLAVEVGPLVNFFTAEEYHQKYLDKNPGGYCHIPGNLFTIQEMINAQKQSDSAQAEPETEHAEKKKKNA